MKTEIKELRAKLSKRVKADNKKFDKADKAGKRVMIAKDVLMQIKTERFISQPGTYCDIRLGECSYGDMAKDNFEHIDDCRVCAVGACMVSATKFGNKLTFSELNSIDCSNKAEKLITQYFTPKQILMMETAFEKHGSDAHYGFDLGGAITDKVERDCVDFGCKYDKDDRLVAIFTNIVKNKGTFKP